MMYGHLSKKQMSTFRSDQIKSIPTVKDVKTPSSENHEKEYGIPTLEELGLDTAPLGEDLFPGGEQEALRRLDEHMKRTVNQIHIYILLFAGL